MFRQVHRCKKCGTLDVSFETGSNKVLCSKCKQESNYSDSKVYFNDIINEYKEKTTRSKEDNDTRI